MKRKIKNPGVSFALGIIVSTILLGIGMTIFEAVSQVAQQGYDLEAKSQLFYEHEKAFEAAMYQHNLNGQPGFSQTKKLSSSNGRETTWKVTGRKASPLTGILREGEMIEIPFYYQDGTDNTQIDTDFQLSFSRQDFDTNKEIILPIGKTSNHFNFPSSEKNNVIIGWAAVRTINGKIETFIPRKISSLGDGKFCSNSFTKTTPDLTVSSFFCEATLNATNNNSIDTTKKIIGKILPGEEETTLKQFWSTGKNKKLTFRPLTLFYNQNDSTKKQKIKGIPWRLELINAKNNPEIPTPTFTITTTAKLKDGKFAKQQSVTLKEKTAIGALDSFVTE
ncbi:hypothetical protein CSB37_03255 [bacterium DOLZORAL124_38_8]|nr:MAG: hypothetical protein CSB37_03255 [bacterium DOLZORAL124_38_8]